MVPSSPATLITTKLHRPAAPAHLVPRPRLVEMLERGRSLPLTLVCAPAGFGKTTLVSAWIRDMTATGTDKADPPLAAWLSLDERDSPLEHFLRAFIAAIQTQLPAACASTLDLLAAPAALSFDFILASIANDLALLPRPLFIVLDDYHTISGQPVHDLLSELFRHWPPSVHLVLISRSNPPLPLAWLRACGQIVEIRSRDLRFTSAETTAFLEGVLPMRLSPPAQALLETRTEGWIAGLQLAGLSLAGSDDAESITMHLAGIDASIADYLVDEVLSRQPAVIQEFLLLTSVLDRFCAGLCEALVQTDAPQCNVRACLDWLLRANLFITPLDNQREWHRYHQLFQELLQRRLLAEVGADRVAWLHRRASAWFAERKLIDEAVHHALAARDPELAAALMEAALCDVLNRDDRATLERWLRLLPDELIARRPGLLMIKAWVYQLSWQVEAQAKVTDQIETLISGEAGASLPDNEIQILRGQLLILYGQAAFFGNETERAAALCQQALALLPAEWMYVRGGAMIYLGLSMQADGRGAEAEQMLLAAYESLTEKATSYGLRLLVSLCLVYLHEGQLDQARLTALMLLSHASSAFVIPRCWAHFFLGMVHYHRNELEQAEIQFGAVIQARFATQMLVARASFYGLVLTQQARGQSHEARQTLELLSQFDLQTRGAENLRTQSLRARIMLLQGDRDGALHWAAAFGATPPNQPLLWLEEPAMTTARILVAIGGPDNLRSALRLLAGLSDIARQTHHARFQIENFALQALALDRAGETSEALAALLQAVELSRAGGFVRIFVELGPAMQALLERLIRRGSAVEPSKRILAAFPDERMDPNHRQADGQQTRPVDGDSAVLMVERLTMREIEVLALLRQRLSNKEIAHKLSLSTTTVKRHTANIYGKLGVNRRWDAVIRAEGLGLLPPR